MIWRFKNVGSHPWPATVRLRQTEGDVFSEGDSLEAGEAVQPGCEYSFVVTFKAPTRPGPYIAYFRLFDGEQLFFGQKVWSDVGVRDL